VNNQETPPPLPPFKRETAMQKARLAEDAWNSREPGRVSLAYSLDSRWRNRSEFVNGRQEIVAFLKRKWSKELDYRLIKELWAFEGNRIAVRFAYEWHDDSGNWFRSYGNENWEFDENGLMQMRLASINDLPIKESERKYHWPLGRRPDDHPGNVLYKSSQENCPEPRSFARCIAETPKITRTQARTPAVWGSLAICRGRYHQESPGGDSRSSRHGTL
jgi:nuclear transport factor 2 (NTF2) superfamily protein